MLTTCLPKLAGWCRRPAKPFQVGTAWLFQSGSPAPGFAAAAVIGPDQLSTKQDRGHALSVGGGDVGEHAAVIFRAGDVGDGDRVSSKKRGECLARPEGRIALGIATRLHLRRIDAADANIHPHAMARPDER